MSYYKAVDLLRLAELANSRHLGVGLAEIEETFEVDRRTAQRMTKALEAVFPHVETSTDVERRKYWKLTGDDLPMPKLCSRPKDLLRDQDLAWSRT